MQKIEMGKAARDWTQIYAIYGMEEWQTLMFLLFQAISFSFLSILFLIYFNPISSQLEALLHALPAGAPRFIAGFAGSVTAISGGCLFYAAGNFLYSSIALHWEMAQRMLAVVGDWSAVKTALDVGCGRGILLNAVALQLKKEGSSGRVVGLDKRKTTTVSTLRTARTEGVQEYVTCREGDARHLPFPDNYFDVVVTGVHLHKVGKEFGSRSAAAAAERIKSLGEIVRVLKSGGTGIVWDLVHVPEYVHRLQELRMEDIRVSERVTAFMMSSQIVSFRKPSHETIGAGEIWIDWRCHEIRVDWRCHNIC